jgi:hypothetical protein
MEDDWLKHKPGGRNFQGAKIQRLLGVAGTHVRLISLFDVDIASAELD